MKIVIWVLLYLLVGLIIGICYIALEYFYDSFEDFYDCFDSLLGDNFLCVVLSILFWPLAVFIVICLGFIFYGSQFLINTINKIKESSDKNNE